MREQEDWEIFYNHWLKVTPQKEQIDLKDALCEVYELMSKEKPL